MMTTKEINRSGWYCDMVKGVRMCVPFEEYLDNGFIAENANTYEELFRKDSKSTKGNKD